MSECFIIAILQFSCHWCLCCSFLYGFCKWMVGWMALTRFPSVCPCMAPRCSRSVEISRAYQRLHSWRPDALSAAGGWHGETIKYQLLYIRDTQEFGHTRVSHRGTEMDIDLLSESHAHISLQECWQQSLINFYVPWRIIWDSWVVWWAHKNP